MLFQFDTHRLLSYVLVSNIDNSNHRCRQRPIYRLSCSYRYNPPVKVYLAYPHRHSEQSPLFGNYSTVFRLNFRDRLPYCSNSHDEARPFPLILFCSQTPCVKATLEHVPSSPSSPRAVYREGNHHMTSFENHSNMLVKALFVHT